MLAEAAESPMGADGIPLESAAGALLADADRDLDRGALEAELLAQPALDEAPVAGLDEAGGEEDEPRRLGARLGREEDAWLLATAHRVRVRRHDLAEEGVEPAGRDARLPRRQRRVEGGDELLHVAAGARRHVDPRCPGDLHEVALDLALEEVPALLVGEVPLVVGDDERAPGVDDLLDDADVLLRDDLRGVDEDHGDLGLLERRLGPQRGVEVGTTSLVDPAPDAGRVDEPPGAPPELDELVDGVAGGAGDRVDDDPLAPHEFVEHRGLADVGP